MCYHFGMDDAHETRTGPRHPEDSPDSDLVRQAVLLYRLLPEPARQSLRALAAIGTPDELAATGQAVGRVIVRSGFDVARRRAAEAADRRYPDGALATEDEIAAEAVRLTRRAGVTAG